jgi:transposase, IS30 family
MSRAGPGGTRSGPPAGAGGLDNLAGAAAQRRDARRWPGLPGNGRAVACRTGRPPPEASETYVQDRLAGVVAPSGGAAVCGPVVPWKGRRQGRRKNRQWARAWSPEQIAQRLRLDFPGDETMRISPEAIYQALYVQSRGALRRELTACLRTGRALRVPRARSRGRGKSHVAPEIMISQRPVEATDRAVPGHWEGDLIIGLGSSAIGTLVERTTRFTILLHLIAPLAPHARSRR